MKRSSMRYLIGRYLIGVLILTLAVSFLFGCAAKTKTTQGNEKSAPPPAIKEEMVKPEIKPEVGPEIKPEVQSPPKPSEQETTVPPPSPATAPSLPPPLPQARQEPVTRTVEIMLHLVNLRQGPRTNDKILRVLKKGTKLTVLEEKEGWLHVRLEDGAEGWVGKSTTSEAIQPSPSAPPKRKK